MEESFQENLYLNRSELNVEKLIKERKNAKLMIFFASIGVFAGVSAFFMFFFSYKLLITPTFALVSAMIAVISIYIHIQFLRDYWQIWTYQLKYWYGLSVFLQIVFVTTFIACIILGIYYKQSFINVESFYITAVWVFMCWKWSFALFCRTKKYRKMFTRYSLIGAEEEIDSE